MPPTESPEETVPAFTLIVVARDEGATIDTVATELTHAMTSASLSFELVLVDNGSHDATGVEMDNWTATHPTVPAHVIHNTGNSGLGHGLRIGAEAARGHWLVTVPGDGQLDPQQLVDLLRHVSAR